MEFKMKKLIALLFSAALVALAVWLVPYALRVSTTAPIPTPTPSSAQPVPVPTAPSPSPTALSNEEYVRQLIAGMTLEEKVGQLFLARCPKNDAVQLAQEYQLGGYLLFSRDFKNSSAEQVREQIAAYQTASSIPMLIAVDEEGGKVVRISQYSQFRCAPFDSPRDLFQQGGYAQIASDTAEKSQLLLSLGINVNLAPVCDISDDPDDFIYPRSFGGDPSAVSQYVETVVTAMEQENIGSCLKHFPGYGSNEDTHTGIAYDHRDYAVFQSADFLPFSAGIQAGADSVLVSHNIVYSMDDSLPASLSPAVHRILREELKFSGVIMTDDLYMDAIKEYTGNEEAAILAVLAGSDLLCCTDFQEQLPAVLHAVENGRIPLAQVEDSVARILLWKLELGLIQNLS